MEVLVLDLDFNPKPTKNPVNKDLKSSEKDFSSTLKAVEERKQNRQIKIYENKEELKEASAKDLTPVDEEDEVNKEKVLEQEEVKTPIIYDNIFRIIDTSVIEDESLVPLELETAQKIASVENQGFNEEDPMNILKEEDSKIDIEKNQRILREENIELANNFIDIGEKETPVSKSENLQLDSNIQATSVKFQEKENPSVDEFVDSSNNITNNYIPSAQKMGNKLDSETQTKSYNPEIELVNEEGYEPSNKEIDIEVDSQNIFTTNKEFIVIKENSLELGETEVVDKKDLIHQIVEKVKLDFQSPKNEIRIKLKPEILGEMTMKIEVAKGAITAKIMVENQKTKEIIEGNIIQLKEEIKDTGLEIKTFEVFVGKDGDLDKHSFNHFNFNQSNRRIRIRSSNSKASLSYDDKLTEITNEARLYKDGGLDLLA
ncbi:MAG: flagellar hook-length control protein FliK [Tissierellia bacterium]|nr:flagellar hook-length control protein FliK [Tissierellia bacterium]